MPEGDAVWRTARRLHEGLAGKVMTDWQLRWPSVAVSDHRAATTIEVVSRGKHILHRLDDGWTLHSHLRMDGSWTVKPPAQVTRGDLAKHTLRALVGCADATALGTSLGELDLVPTEREHELVGHLGPDLLGADWDADLAVANLLALPARHVGAALLDQRNLAGIGTMWDAEVLWLERIHPWRTVGELGQQILTGIAARAHDLLQGAIPYRWSVSTGNPADPLYAHARDGLPCKRCRRDAIRVDWIGDPPQHRHMFWCPTCQPGPLPPQPAGVGRPLERRRNSSQRYG